MNWIVIEEDKAINTERYTKIGKIDYDKRIRKPYAIVFELSHESGDCINFKDKAERDAVYVKIVDLLTDRQNTNLVLKRI